MRAELALYLGCGCPLVSGNVIVAFASCKDQLATKVGIVSGNPILSGNPLPYLKQCRFGRLLSDEQLSSARGQMVALPDVCNTIEVSLLL